MAEHTGPNQFEVLDITIHGRGTIAYFLRRVEEAVTRLKSFFVRANHDYVKFNYLGEWHSHPSFELEPSGRDDRSIREIVEDQDVGANFVVLLIVKLADSGELLIHRGRGVVASVVPAAISMNKGAILDNF